MHVVKMGGGVVNVKVEHVASVSDISDTDYESSEFTKRLIYFPSI